MSKTRDSLPTGRLAEQAPASLGIHGVASRTIEQRRGDAIGRLQLLVDLMEHDLSDEPGLTLTITGVIGLQVILRDCVADLDALGLRLAGGAR